MNQKLQRIDKWRDATFEPGSAPHLATIRRWCEQGKVVARKLGGQWYIAPEHEPESITHQSSDALAASIIERLG